MLKRIKSWLSLKKIQHSNNPLQTFNESLDKEAEVRVKKASFSQEQMCSMRPHDAKCDVISCVKNPCFAWEPDKIVSKPYNVKRKKSVPMKRVG